jgi:cytochrome c553
MKNLLAVLALAAGTVAAVVPAADAAAADIVANPKAAPNKIEQCIGCHGIPEYKTAYPEVYRVPMIGGQSAKYIEAALQAYKKGDRKHPQMNPTAQRLSDQDIADIAAYYAQQGPAK